MAGGIFISYRRGDDPGNTGRLFDRMQEVFRPEQLFMDVDSIAPGLDFVAVLEEQVAKCDVLLAVIGRYWTDIRDETGARRLDNPRDFVRIEIESALNQSKRVIPVLVGAARMPDSDELPESMKPLARHNAVRLTHERFRADAHGLIKAVQQALDDVEVLRQAQAEATRQAKAAEERKREVEAANERAKAEREAEEKARQDREEARVTKIEELTNWDSIMGSRRAQDFRDHLARFPGGLCERMVRQKLAALAWAALGNAPSKDALNSYLQEFPEESEEVMARLKSLAEQGSRQPLKAQKVRLPLWNTLVTGALVLAAIVSGMVFIIILVALL
jgi:hypothetical protein